MERILQQNDIANGLLLDSIVEPTLVINKFGDVLYVNEAWEQIKTQNGEEMDLMLTQDSEFRIGIRAILNKETPRFYREIELMEGDKHNWFIFRALPIQDEEGRVLGALIELMSITNEKLLEQVLHISEVKLNLILQQSHDVIKVTDLEGRILYSSPSHLKVFGYQDVGMSIFDDLEKEDRRLLEDVYRNLRHHLDSQVVEVRRKHDDGYPVWIEASVSPIVSHDGKIVNVLIVSRDISERKRMQKKLEYMAYRDFLTGLYNRRKFITETEKKLQQAKEAQRPLAVLMLDVNKFKLYNDRLGHDIGDAILQEVARRLMRFTSEQAIVGRLSGDEFAMCLVNVDSMEEIQAWIAKVSESLRDPWLMEIPADLPKVSASIGWAAYPNNGASVGQLLKQADVQLYRVKAQYHRQVHAKLSGRQARRSYI